MISLDDATALIFDSCAVNRMIDVPIEQAIGYALKEDIVSPIDVVSFRNSAMDGFAVCAEWLDRGSASNPISLSYHDTVFAGEDASHLSANSKEPIKIMTGAVVPNGFDSVVPFEETEYDDKIVSFKEPITTGANVRLPGEDVKEGDKLYLAGYTLQPFDIGILAGIGMSHVKVLQKPSVLIATTGNELVEPGRGDSENKLLPGQIFNSNLYTISSMLKNLCDKVTTSSIITDDADALDNLFDSTADILITTGGVSAGEKDLIRPAAEKAGWQTVFHKIKIKPGKPVYFARRNHQLLFGLPGNPLSAAVICAVLVIPALKKIAGRTNYQLEPAPAVWDDDNPRKSKRFLIWPGSFKDTAGQLSVRFSAKKSSAALTALKDSDGLIFQSEFDGKNPTRVSLSAVRWADIF